MKILEKIMLWLLFLAMLPVCFLMCLFDDEDVEGYEYG